MEVYHTSSQAQQPTEQRLSPYAYVVEPPIGRLLIVIGEHCGVGGTIRPRNRALADWAGYKSAGHISDLLDELTCAGWIFYDRDTGLITLLADPVTGSPIPPPDQPSEECEPENDDSEVIPTLDQRSREGIDSGLIPSRDRVLQQQGAEIKSIPHRDQNAPRMEDHVLRAAVDLRDSAAARYNIPCGPELIPPPDHPAAARLIELDADPKTLAEICAAQPDLTPDELEPQWVIAQERESTGDARNARALLFGTLKKPGGRLYGRLSSGAVDWKPYIQAQEQAKQTPPDNVAVGCDPPDPPDPADETIAQAVDRLAPADASERDKLFLAQQLHRGASDANALAALVAQQNRGTR